MITLTHILHFLNFAGSVISIFAVAIIVGGFALASVNYVFQFRKLARKENFKNFRIQLGRALILGLEILVLGDVIETITVEPSVESLSLLAFLLLVRVVVCWTLTLEIEGRWPWKTPLEDQDNA